MMAVPMDSSSAPSSRERAQRLFKKNIELENGLRRSAQAKVPSDPNTWDQMRENYEKIILEDHEFSEKHDVEYLLWQLHYRRIEEFRQHLNAATSAESNASSSGKGLARPDRIRKIRAVFKSFLTEATGFYHELILKIRANYGLPLSYFDEGPDNQITLMKDEKKSAELKNGLMSCHRCLIYLGDLARYKGLYGEGDSISRDYGAASSYYIQAASLCPSSGNPHHQLAILASYSGDDLLALYRYFRSLGVESPFSTARDNLIIAFEKNRQSYSQLRGNLEGTSGKMLASRLAGRGRGRGNARVLAKDTKTDDDSTKEQELAMPEVLKAFLTRFIRLNGVLFTRTSLETFGEISSSVTTDLHVLLSSGPEEELNFGPDATENALVVLRLIVILIFTIHNVKKESETQSYAEILQRTVLLQNAFTATFMFTGYILKRCAELRDAASSYLLPALLVFIEWLACNPDIASFDVEDKQAGARAFFWNQFISFMNKLILTGLASVDGDEDEACFFNMSRYDEGETGNRLALWEDFELRGFLPLVPAQVILDFSRKHTHVNDGSMQDTKFRVQRILSAGRALTGVVQIGQQRIYIDPNLKRFVMAMDRPAFKVQRDSGLSSATESAIIKQGSQVDSITNLGVSEPKPQLYMNGGEVEGEEIVFKPTACEKYSNLTASTSIFDFTHPVQVPSADGWAFCAPNLSVPLDSVQFSTISNATAQLYPVASNVLQLPQNVSSEASRWLMKEEVLLSNKLKNMNIIENGFSGRQMLQEGLGNLQHTSYSPVFSAPANPNITSAFPSKIKAAEVLPPSFNNLMPSGSNGLTMKLSAAFPVSRKSVVSRPVRHLGPPPGFSHVSAKQQEETVFDTTLKAQHPEVDDYSWLDGYKSSSTKDPQLDNSFNQTSKFPRITATSSSAFTSPSSFPFPGKQVSGVQTEAIDEQKLQDFQLFEQLKLNAEKQFQNTNSVQSLLPERQVQSLWSGQYLV